MAVTRACRATVARVVLPWLRSPCPKTRETPRNDARDRGTAPVAGAFVRSSKRVRAPPLGSSPSLHRDRECPPFSLSNPHPLLSRMPPFPFVRLRLSLPLPHAPPLPTRHDAPSRAMAKQGATTTPFLRSKVEGTGSRGDGGPSAPAPPSTESEDRKKKNERTNEGPRKQRGAFDFRRRGVSIYFSQHSLFRVDFQSVFATLNLKRTHAHRKICLP